ncbi:MAG TPA: hypothetical protein PK511_11220 [Chitinophagales bacterium]|nr:hypothetical protein [Chitinophagales bacterium]HMU69613.1 hypothetical protein [Chitinophagales bacterium]HMX05287.1 hypothetical protein [Chitinophagales bacterium]HMZ88479.1 hypothetical protein [Chitinophagales bacterium]HNA57810.1 hypothetical protein [Chitinophagales bacterium]
MNRIKNYPPDPMHFAISAGLKIMVVPCFYWLAVFSATLFEKPVLVKWLLLDDSVIMQALLYPVMIMLPLITLLINIKARYERRIVDAVRSPFANRVQFGVMGMALLSLIGVFTYTFFERLDFWMYITGK